MKNGMTKRSISILMTIVLVLGMIVTALPAGFFMTTTEAAVTYAPDKLGACVLPNAAYGSTKFMESYVYNNASFSLNEKFKASAWSGNLTPGISGKSLNMSKYTKKNHDSQWSAAWRYSPSNLMKNLMDAGQIKLGYRANLYNDKHSNGSRHWGQKWGKAMIKISGSSQRQLVYKETEDRDDEKSQTVSGIFKVGKNDYFEYWAGNNRCVCNGSCVGSSVIYAVDTTAPTITRSYISKKIDGGAVSSATDGFKAKDVGYLIIECSESIRFATGSASPLKLNLKAYWKSNKQEAGTVSAELVQLKGKNLVFKFTVPEKMNSSAINVRIDSFEMPSGDEKWAKGSYEAKFVDANGKAKSFNGYSLTASSKITDLAGNGLDWGSNSKTISNYVYMDNVNTSVQKVELDNKKVTRTDVPVDESAGDISKSDVYTAVGDQLTFTVTFNDRLKYDTTKYRSDSEFLNAVTATLNIKDDSGFVTVKAKSMEHLGASVVDGVNSALGQKTKITFDVLIVNQYMYQEGGQPIKITALNGMNGVTDICGNSLVGIDNVTVIPNKQQYIDRLAPKATLGLEPDKGVYTPISTNNGKILTFPINVDDEKESSDSQGNYISGTTGIRASFKWVCGSGDDQYFYDYCWTTTANVPGNAKWKSLYTTTNANDTDSSKMGTFIEYEKENGTLYLHIRLKDNEDYGAATEAAKGKVSGNLVIETMDYAGNKGTDTFALSHMADNTKPSLEQKGSSIDGNAERTSADITTNIKVTDDYGVQSVTYEWSGQSAKQCDLSTITERRGFEIPITASFDDTDTDEEKKKTVSLKVTITDYAGHKTEDTYTYTLYFGKIENRYSIEAGTAANPLAVPVLKMKQPAAIQNANGETSELLSYVEVEFKDGSRYLYICDSTEEKDIFTQSDWYYVDNKSADEGSTPTKLTYNFSGTVGSQSAYESLKQQLKQCYGTGDMTITVRTVDNFNASPKSSGKLEVTYESTDAIAVNTHTDIYIAQEGNYSVAVESIIDNTGKDVSSLLAFDEETSEQTADSLDGVSFLYTLTGEKESIFNYNFADINLDESYVALMKSAYGKHTATAADSDDDSYDSSCETFSMAGVREQGITMPSDIVKNYGSGWYYLKFVVTTVDGDQYITYYNDIYLDDYVYTDFRSGDYEKTYSRTLEYKGETKTVDYRTAFIGTEYYEDEVINVGIAPVPEGYTLTQQLIFELDSPTVNNGYLPKLKFRMYNQADTAYAQNAQWRELPISTSDWPYNVQEVAKDEDGNYVFDVSSYKKDDQYYLPLTEGMNVICYEVQSMNGQTTKKMLYINATKETISKEYDKEQTLTEAKWSLSESVTADNQYAVMKFHDFYEEDIYSNDIELHAYESGTWEFVLYNDYSYYYDVELDEKNDNLVADVITIEDVDGINPAIEDVEYQQDGMNFCYQFTVKDNGNLDYDNLVQLHLDGMYAYKVRKANGTLPEEETPGDSEDAEPTPQPTASTIPENVGIDYNIPLVVNEDVSGTGVWTDYGTQNFGIYKTQIDWDREASEAKISIWGTFVYQDDLQEGENGYGDIYLDVFDDRGNSSYCFQGFYYENTKPTLEVSGSYEQDSEEPGWGNMYKYNEKTCFDADGNLMAECAVPLSKIQSYGAGKTYAAVSKVTDSEEMGGNMDYEMTYYSPYRYHFLNTIPMIRSTGQYEMEYTDLFGNTYIQNLDTTNAFEEGSDRIQVNYSETTQTNQNVTVMANLVPASGEAVDADAKITTIAAVSVDENGNRVVGKTGEIDLIDRTAARIIMEDNGEVYIEGFYNGQSVSKTVKVSNIDKKIEEVEAVFLYGDGVTKPNFMENSEDTVDGSVKVILECEEDLYGINGDTKYVFPVGSKKGDTYTFEYRDEAGNTGSVTVTLPYNVDKLTPPVPDTTAPEFSGIISGLRQSYTALDGIFDYDDAGNTAETTRANGIMASYTARGYKIAFQITDESKVKLVAKMEGAEAPTSYSDKSDSIDGLKIKGYTVEITKPAKFDLYLVDEADNVKALKGFDVNSFDQEVAEAEVQYKVLRDENDVAFVRAYLVADAKEEVVATNRDATTFMNEEVVTEAGVETTKHVKRYYHDFFDNETYEFTYMDVYGNTGHTTAEVKGFDYGAPSQIEVQWFGTKRMTGTDAGSAVINEAPDTEGLTVVNHNITAGISYNKAVNNVRLYAYDETKENGVGAELTSADAVSAVYTGKTVTVTYENNYNQKVVVAVQAKNSGKKAYTVLPAVQCIDKQAPLITVSQGVLSQNKQMLTYTITTDKETFFNNGTQKATEHTYTVSANGEHVITAVDGAGNIASYTIRATEIDDTPMELMFGLLADGSDMTADIESLQIKTGDTLYVKASKEAQIVLGEKSLHLMAGETGSFQLTADAGMYLLRAADASTGKEQTYKVLMIFRDRSAPLISFETNVLSFPVETDKETIEAALRNGITVEDNKDGIMDSSKVVISGIPEQWKKGIHVITYEISDSEGNKASATRSVYLYEEGTPSIQINGADTMPYGTTVVDSSVIRVKGTNLSNGAILMKYRPGIKTVAQMKYGTTGISLKGIAKNEEQTFMLPKRSGFYTLYIRTQDRKEQITYVYVDLSE